MLFGPWYRFCRFLIRWFAFLPLGGVRVLHSDRVPLRGRLIVAPVHLSLLDPPLVAVAMPRQITFMAKSELFKGLFGSLIRSLGAFPIRRGESDSEAIRFAIELLEQDRALLMFPEGTRGNGKQLGSITKGIAMLAKRTDAPVIPIALVGTETIFPKGAKKLRRAKMTVAFGYPIRFKDCANRDEFAQKIEESLLALMAEAGLPLLPPAKKED